MVDAYRGIFSIANTPFDDDGTLLWGDFAEECDWIVRAKAHGFVWPVMASEYTVLAYPERVQGMRIAVETVAGRIPVVIGVADTSTAGAVALAAEAGKAGADAIIAMPPWSTKVASRDSVKAYYQALAQAGGIPVFVQNAGPPLGSSLPASFVAELFRDIALVQYLKEEKPPQGHSISEIIDLAEPAIHGVFSGGHCRWLVPQFERGISGSMPGPHLTDVHVQIWDLLEAGDLKRAREMQNRVVVLENALLSMSGMAGKEVLRRRGVISCSAPRNSGPFALDEHDIAELEYGMGLVEPYFST